MEKINEISKNNKIQLKKDKNSYEIYSSCLTLIFEKMQKNLSQKNPYFSILTQFLGSYKDFIEEDKIEEVLNASKYYKYIEMSLRGDNKKIADIFVEKIQILIKNKLFNVESFYNSIDSDDNYELNNKKLKIKPLINHSLINCISEFKEINDENIWLNSLKTLYLIYQNTSFGIHEKPLSQIISFCFFIFSSAKSNVIIESSQNILKSIINSHFKNYKKFYNFIQKDYDDLNDNNIYNNIENTNLTFNNNDFLIQNYKTPIDRLIIKEIRTIIDEICIYEANLKMNKNSRLELIPKSKIDLLNDEYFFSFHNPKILNEKNIENGKFGWCFICRNKADYYDRESRKPICSNKCKELIKEIDNKIDRFLNGQLINEDDIAQFYSYDCKFIFVMLCKLVNSNNLPSKNQYFNYRTKLLSLDLLNEIIKKFGEFLKNEKYFSFTIKGELIESLLAFSLNDEKKLFEISINLFFNLWECFREQLKIEIGVFNETVFLKILESNNYSYEHKLCVLQHLKERASKINYFLELYANYDCEINEKFLVYRIVSSLGEIGQGKYSNKIHLMQNEEEKNLKLIALETINLLVDSIYHFCISQNINNLDNNNSNNNESEREEINLNVSNNFFDEQKIDENLRYKSNLEKGIEKFNIKYKKGIKYLISSGIISQEDKEEEAKDIANFLKRNNLNKEEVGEILGDNSEINLKVLKNYTDLFNFSGLDLINSLRKYLCTFKLPGEGQKIDRILDVFSNKYNKDNPNKFENKETSYYLSFTIIILQTELHNPNVKEKMGFDGFLNLLSTQESTKNLNKEYLQNIYNDILNNPLSLPEIEKEKEKLNNRENRIKLESTRLLNECKERLKQGKGKQYIIIYEFQYIYPFMESIWSPLLAVFSVVIEQSNDENLYQLCIDGITKTIKILSFINLDLAKDALIKGLCNLTNLFQFKEIKDKNIECLKKIFELSLKDGNSYFKNSWKIVLKIINKLDSLLTVKSMPKSERENYFQSLKIKRKKSLIIENDFDIEKNNIEFINKITSEDYEKIFLKSEKMNDDSILDFINSLCELSIEDIILNNRYFLLHKLIEVTELCMNRNYLIWLKIWEKVSKILIEISLNDNQEISEKGIDCLRQLSKKYLEYKNNNDFQIELLRPFRIIFQKSDINTNENKRKEFAIVCFINLIQNDGKYIVERGWKKIIELIKIISKEKDEELKKQSFDFLKWCINNYLKKNINLYNDITNCLVSYSSSFPEEILVMLFQIINEINDKNKLIISLKDLAELIIDKRDNVSMISLKGLFDILNKRLKEKKFDKNFSSNIKDEIFFPLSEKLLEHNSGEILMKFIQNILLIINNNKDFLNQNQINFILNLVKKMCNNNKDGKVCINGVKCFEILINQKNLNLIKDYPLLLFKLLVNIFENNLQSDFESFEKNSEKINIEILKNNSSINILRSQVVIILLNTLENFLDINIQNIEINELEKLIILLKRSYEIAIKFNKNFELRKIISSDNKKSVVIYSQEERSLDLYFTLLNYCFDRSELKEKYTNKIYEMSIYVLKIFVEETQNLNEINLKNQKDNISINNETFYEKNIFYKHISEEVEKIIISALIKFQYYKNVKYKKEINELLVSCIFCNNDLIKNKLQEILLLALNENL